MLRRVHLLNQRKSIKDVVKTARQNLNPLPLSSTDATQHTCHHLNSISLSLAQTDLSIPSTSVQPQLLVGKPIDGIEFKESTYTNEFPVNPVIDKASNINMCDVKQDTDNQPNAALVRGQYAPGETLFFCPFNKRVFCHLADSEYSKLLTDYGFGVSPSNTFSLCLEDPLRLCQKVLIEGTRRLESLDAIKVPGSRTKRKKRNIQSKVPQLPMPLEPSCRDTALATPSSPNLSPSGAYVSDKSAQIVSLSPLNNDPYQDTSLYSTENTSTHEVPNTLIPIGGTSIQLNPPLQPVVPFDRPTVPFNNDANSNIPPLTAGLLHDNVISKSPPEIPLGGLTTTRREVRLINAVNEVIRILRRQEKNDFRAYASEVRANYRQLREETRPRIRNYEAPNLTLSKLFIDYLKTPTGLEHLKRCFSTFVVRGRASTLAKARASFLKQTSGQADKEVVEIFSKGSQLSKSSYGDGGQLYGMDSSVVARQLIINEKRLHLPPFLEEALEGKKDTDTKKSQFGDCSNASVNLDGDEDTDNTWYESSIAALNTQQRDVLRLSCHGYNMFIGGDAGTGKSFLMKLIIAYLRHKYKLRVAVTASTGIAALNIGGITFHSYFGAAEPPTNVLQMRQYWINQESSCPSLSSKFSLQGSFAKSLLRDIDVIVIDEISMLSEPILSGLSCAAKEARLSSAPFGGIQVLFTGDFMQLKSVSAEVNPFYSSNDSSIKMGPDNINIGAPLAPVTPLFKSAVFLQGILHVKLTQVMRQAEDAEFLSALNDMRVGKLPDLIVQSAILNPPCESAIRLYPRKHDAKAHNTVMMQSIPQPSVSFPCHVEIKRLPGIFSDTATFCTLDSNATCETIQWLMGHQGHAPPSSFFLIKLRKFEGKQDAFQFAVRVRTTAAKQSQLSDPLKNPGSFTREGTNILHKTLLQMESKRLIFDIHFHTHSVEGKNVDSEIRSKVKTRGAIEAMRDMTLDSKELKIGARVMLLRNLSGTLVNGKVGTIVGFDLLDFGHNAFKPLLPLYRKAMIAVEEDDKNGDTSITVPILNEPDDVQEIPSSEPLSISTPHLDTNSNNPTEHSFSKTDDFSKQPQPNVNASRQVLTLTPRSRLISHSPHSIVRPIPRVLFDDGQESFIPYIEVPLPSSNVVSSKGAHTPHLTPASPHSNMKLSVVTMPLVPAYAFTVHKVQGLTIKQSVVLDCRRMWRCDHLVYVAASRVRKREDLRIIGLKPDMISIDAEALRFTNTMCRDASDVAKDILGKISEISNVNMNFEGSIPSQSKEIPTADWVNFAGGKDEDSFKI